MPERLDPRPKLAPGGEWVRPNDYSDPVYKYRIPGLKYDEYGFFDETWCWSYAPYLTEKEAREALRKYADSL